MRKKVLDKIVHRAERYRKKDERQSGKEQQPFTLRQLGEKTPLDDERRDVYYSLNQYRFGFFWLLPLAVLVVPSYLFYVGKKISLVQFLLICVLSATAPIVRYSIFRLTRFVSFSKFRTWRAKLPFKLSGWEETVDSEDFTTSAGYWIKRLSMTVDCSASEVSETVLNSYLTVLVKMLGAQFYKSAPIIPNYASDPRVSWTTQERTASGSANSQVVRVIYGFLKKELAELERSYHCIERITFTPAKDVFFIPPEKIDSEGSAG